MKPEQPNALPTCNWSGKYILIAEDEDSNYELLKYYLQKNKAKFDRAENGIEAIELLKKSMETLNPYDLILMDIKMPLMDGIDAMKQIKTIAPKIPIIAQTAYAMQQEKEQYLEAGFDDYITKPISILVFNTKLELYLNKQ